MSQFIVIDGIDGAGKSTVAEMLASTLGYQYLKSPGKEFSGVREYFENPDLMLARFYFYAATTLYLSETIRQELSAGNSVVCDRYIYSTIAYHRAMGLDINNDTVKKLFATLVKPTYYCALAADFEVCKQRIQQRGVSSRADQWLEKDIALQQNVVEQFRLLNVPIIDTSVLEPIQVCNFISNQAIK